ncbi:MAG: imidazole glycerol phosphate synthase subunit HisH [Candidatus Peribacteraceae bacterium]|nr:imidazole glycerol phosphate synthase subunit HisH [Candidatus Peribacteraceae bacterium]
MIALVDYCAGNLRSVKRALDFLNLQNEVTKDPKKVRAADAIIVPGVGAAGAAMRELDQVGLTEVLREEIPKKPFLGICLGLQILFEKSAEDNAECLGIFKGSVEKFSSADIKVPHIGWNPVDFPSTSSHSAGSGRAGQAKTPQIMEGIKSGTPLYFVHSYFSKPKNPEIVKATTTHGETFPAVLNRDKIWAVQFHPEKSGEAGLKILDNFAKLI